MNTWSILAWLAGIFGVGGLAAFSVFVATGGLPMLAGGLVLSRFLPTPAGLWRFFTSLPGICILVLLAMLASWLAGDVNGSRRERQACEARIQASVKAAREFDAQIAEDQRRKALEQQQQAEARVAEAEQRVVDYEQTHKSCDIGAAGADFLNGNDGVPTPPGRILPNAPKPPRRP